MAEIIETRSRSRSKTPGPLLMAENGDSNKKGSKVPTISLIEEEDDVVEVVPMSQPTRPKRPRRNAKVTTTIVDTSSDVSVESPKNSQSVSKTVVTTTVTETVTKTTNGSEESSSHEQATTTNTVTKSSIDAPENQSIFNNIFNAIKTSTPILSNKRSKRITQDITEINVADHPAYKEYKEAGEYWNKYPKTDYTYSELSPHRRELSNGVVAMPNMSRRSLEKYTTRVEAMIQNNPADETFLRRKFLANTSSTNSSFQKRSADLQYDSADEVDVSELRKQLQARRKPAANNVLSRFFLAVVSYFYSVYYSSKQTVRRIFYKNESYAYTPVRRSSAYKQGIFLQSFEAVKRFILLGFSKVYLFVSTILCLDTWILYTRSDNQIENRKRKRFLLGLLVLLPLLLLGALILSDESKAVEKLFTFTEFSAPTDLLSVKRYFRDLSLPEFSLGWLWAPFISIGAGLRGFLFKKSSSEELKMALDEDKFQLLLAHIDNYIDSALGQRFEENNKIVLKETSDKLTLIIGGTVKEALVNYQYQLTQSDIEIIAERIRKLMNSELSDKEKKLLNKISLSNEESFVKIQEQIKQNLSLHFNEIKLGNQNVDLNEILEAVLRSEKLSAFISSSVKPAYDRIDQHDLDLEAIRVDMTKLKNEVAGRFTVIGKEISELSGQQKNLGDHFYKFKLENDEKLQKLLSEIDEKLSTFSATHFTSVDASVRKNLLTILGFDSKSSDVDMSEETMKNWISSMFVAKNYLEERLQQVELNSNKAFKLQLDENAGILMNEINEEIKKQVAIAVAAKAIELEAGKTTIEGGLSEEDVKRIVKGVLAIYDADKTGLVDFALESAGGQVLSTRCTENYQTKSAEISIFGIPLWYPSNTPRTVISPSVQPGECWAFQGFPGYIVIKLNNLIHITGFTLEHISQSLAPNGIIDSAPNKFSVWGLLTEMDKDPVFFGEYFYAAEEGAASLQYFPVQNVTITEPYQIIELRIESNHGNPRYTCLYRFRVHGNTVKP